MVWSAEWVLVPLALLSLIVITLIIFNIFWLRSSNIIDTEFYETATHLLKDRKLEDLLELSSQNHTATARVLTKVLEFARENHGTSLEALKEIAEVEGNRATMRLNQPNTLLMDMGVMAPLVGLLGTVFGILRAFGSIASDATPMRTMLLAGGVSQALVSTAIGLCVGLLAMICYSFFRSRVQSLVGEFESTLTELMVKTYDCLAKGR
jgi:biopolymer transport protein ExbB